MSKQNKILNKIVSGTSDSNISFRDTCYLLTKLGFKDRINGDHHIYFREDIGEIINLQPKDGMTKNYQVKQVRNLILKYKLGEIHDKI